MKFIKTHSKDLCFLFLAISLALIIRLYSHHHNPVINPDGANCYIQQAKAIYYGQFHKITLCYSYLSLYPILVALCYPLIGDWVLSGQIVSLVFSLLSFIPLYYFTKKFFDDKICFLILIIWACIPSYVIWSYYVIRDTIYWFFSLLGLYFFILYLHKRKNFIFICSLLCFIIGAWCRIECLLYLSTSVLFFTYINIKNKKQLILFSLFFIAFIIITSIILYSSSISLHDFFAYEKILNRVKYVVSRYESLREVIKKFEDYDTGLGFHYFFSNCKNLLWWIALGTLIIAISKALYFPFFVLFSMGLYLAKGSIKKDIRFKYLFLNVVLSFLALYVQILYNWAASTRYMALLLFPGFVFIGYAFKSILHFIESKYPNLSNMLFLLILLSIFVVTFPKNFYKKKNPDNIVYRQIGLEIAKSNKSNKIIKVGGAFKRVNIIYFYANINYHGPVCFPSYLAFSRQEVSPELILSRNLDYYVMKSEKEKKLYEFPGFNKYFKEIASFKTKKLGTLKLLKINKNE